MTTYSDVMERIGVCEPCFRSLKPAWTQIGPFVSGLVLSVVGAPLGVTLWLMLGGNASPALLATAALSGFIAGGGVYWAVVCRRSRRRAPSSEKEEGSLREPFR
jgi:membrane associated rhomboid family serine protease